MFPITVVLRGDLTGVISNNTFSHALIVSRRVIFVYFFDGGEEGVFDVFLLFLFGGFGEFDVELVAGEFGGEADVLALATDGDGLLVFGDEDFGALALNFDLTDFGRGEGFADVFGGVVAPVDDVDFFAIADFVHDSLDADTATTDEGTDRVDAGDGGGDGDFGATAGFAGDGFNFDAAIFDFGDFLTEEMLDKLFVATTEDELGTTLVALDTFDEDFEAGADGVIFTFDLLRFGHNAVGFADVDADEFGFDAGNHAGHDGVDFVFEHLQDDVALGFAEALDDDLFGGLAGDATEAGDFVFFLDDVAEFFLFASFTEGDFATGIKGDVVFYDSAHDENVSFAGVEVEFGADVHVSVAVVFAPSGGDGLLDDFQDDFLGEIFLLCDDVDHAG